MYHNRRYRGDREMEEMSGGHVILIGQDNAGDCLITSGDVPGGPEMDIGCHDMTVKQYLKFPSGLLII